MGVLVGKSKFLPLPGPESGSSSASSCRYTDYSTPASNTFILRIKQSNKKQLGGEIQSNQI